MLNDRQRAAWVALGQALVKLIILTVRACRHQATEVAQNEPMRHIGAVVTAAELLNDAMGERDR